ncbi:MAG: DUF3810 family protein [Acetatifactor sp.]|nr:DUF3810 family protein [Acetatifactor sp.]
MAQKRRAVLYLSIAILTVLLNILAWSSTAFCDAYVTYVFPLWTNTYGRLMGIFPFSVGEWMLILGIVLILVAVFTAVSVLFLSWHTFARLYLRFCAWVLVCVCLIMTLNCSMLYHVTPF